MPIAMDAFRCRRRWRRRRRWRLLHRRRWRLIRQRQHRCRLLHRRRWRWPRTCAQRQQPRRLRRRRRWRLIRRIDGRNHVVSPSLLSELGHQTLQVLELNCHSILRPTLLPASFLPPAPALPALPTLRPIRAISLPIVRPMPATSPVSFLPSLLMPASCLPASCLPAFFLPGPALTILLSPGVRRLRRRV